MTITKDKKEVPIKEWAEHYDVGDTIEYVNPSTGEKEKRVIIGFSTMHRNIGLPVVTGVTNADAKEVAIPEKFHVNGK